MFRRRRRGEEPGTPDEGEQTAPDRAESADQADRADSADVDRAGRADGPYDVSEVDPDEARSTRVDLGGLLVRVEPGMKLQLQVDQRTGKAGSAVVSTDEAAVQLVAVAAPRTSGLWEQTRLQIAADAKRRGGHSDEGLGPFGTELRVTVPVQGPDGKQLIQRSRISAIDGPRWMLRATFHGKALTDATVLKQLADLVRQTVIVRGGQPMPPGDVIALTPPKGTESGDGPEGQPDQQSQQGEQQGGGTEPEQA